MKNMKSNVTVLLAAAVASAIIYSTTLRAEDTNSAPERIGVYDSRVVAYAHFWSEAHQRRLNETARAAKEAKAAGQSERFNELETALQKEQEQNHLQVFSTAPVDNVLAEIKNRLPAIQAAAGVSTLVSKWDESGLKQHPGAKHVDVTDVLAQEFNPGAKQLKIIAEIKR